MLAVSNGIPRRRVDEVLDWVGLASVGRKRPKGYSLGMSQRLGLAAALLGDPKTLILDEPSNGLDPAGINWLRRLLRSLAADGRTVFVSSHLLAEVSLMADHVVVIGRGRLIADEPVEDFVARSSKAGAVVVRTPHVDRLSRILTRQGAVVQREAANVLTVTGAERAEVGEICFQNGIVLHELSTRPAALEDAFLEATAGSEEFQGERLAGPPDAGSAEPEESEQSRLAAQRSSPSEHEGQPVGAAAGGAER
jgi:ABC-2 type transport system ATP-binding protein